MHHEPKDPRKTLIEELDQLRYTLHESPEIQQNIPMLDEVFGAPEDSFELDIPILTDSLEDEQDLPEGSNTSGDPDTRKAPSPMPTDAVDQPVDCVPTSASVELEDLLDELVAEYLPILENQLREKLRMALDPDSVESDENHVDAS